MSSIHEGLAVDLAVGTTREEAAALFAADIVDGAVTTYDALDHEVDLGSVGVVAAAFGPGFEGLLDHFVQGTHPAELVVGLAPDLRDRDALVGMLEERPRIQVSHLDRSSRGVRVRLARAQGARDSHERALRELATLEPAAAESGPPPDPVASPAAATAAPVRGRQPGHVPVWLRAGLVALGGVIVMIALVLVGHRAWGRDGVVVALLVGLLLGQAMTMLGVLYAIRLARHGRADQRELRRALVNRTDRLRRIARRSVNQSRRGRQELAQAQLKIERLQREITALERFQSRARIQSREEG